MPRFVCGCCPFEVTDPDASRLHLETEHADLAVWLRRKLGPWALACIGVRCWYWEQAQTGDGWRMATITGLGAKDGRPVYDVLILGGGPRLGWSWQVRLRVGNVPPADYPAELRGVSEEGVLDG